MGEVRFALENGVVELQSRIKVRIQGKFRETTVGRALLSEIVPEEIPFEYYNQVWKKKFIGELLNEVYRRCGAKRTVLFADKIRTWGYYYSTLAGISIKIKDLVIPKEKEKLI